MPATRSTLALILLLAACSAAPAASTTAAAGSGDEFIVSIEVGNEALTPEVADWRLDQVVALGARWVRVNIPWLLVEQQRGVLTWTGSQPLVFDLDYLMAAIRARGLRAIGIVQLTPQWACDPALPEEAYCPPADPQDYARFAAETVRRYGDVMRVVEIWNEVDVDDDAPPPPDVPPDVWKPFWHGTVAQYVAMLDAAYDAVKAADPTVIVLSSGLAPLEPDALAIWLDAFFASQPPPKFDWFGWHPYGLVTGAGPDFVDGTTSSFRGFKLIAERLDREGYFDVPILLSEFGYREDIPDPQMQTRVEDLVASLMVEAYAVARSSPRVKGLNWFSLQYHGWEGDYGLFTDSRESRPAARAFATMASTTAQDRFEGREAGTDNGSEPQVVRLVDELGRRLWVIYAPFVPPWYSVDEPQAVTVRTSPNTTLRLVDRDGLEIPVAADASGNATVFATHRPCDLVER